MSPALAGRKERRVWAVVPADFKIASAWVESYGGQSHRITITEDDEEEDAEYREVGWRPFLGRLVVVLAGVTVVVLICLFGLAVAEGIYNALTAAVCAIPHILPIPSVSPPAAR